MSRVHLFFRLTVLGFGFLLFNFDYVKSELTLDDVADLSRRQSKSCFLEFRHHLAVPEPAQIAALVLTSRISRKLFRQGGKVFPRTRAFQNLLSLVASILIT